MAGSGKYKKNLVKTLKQRLQNLIKIVKLIPPFADF